MQGFFPTSLFVGKATESLLPKCGACKLHLQCKSPKMQVSGEGRRKILIVAEAPGAEEDRAGRQLIGNSGKFLMAKLAKLGIDLRRDCWITNAVICRPKDNESPTHLQLDYCRPNLIATLKELEPEIIVPLGAAAVESLIKSVWRESVDSIGTWVGWQIPSQKPNAWICPVYHPSFILRAKNPVAEVLFTRHLKAISKLSGRPWDQVPDWEKDIQIIYDPKEAAKQIRLGMAFGPKLTAFDYECNRLKPEAPDREIVSCSICFNDNHTIAYPWIGEAIEATKTYLKSPLKKVASNMKFEERWTLEVLGFPVNAWRWDTMLEAHILDNRPGICSIKFQSYIHLGMPCYDEHIKRFLQTKGSQKVNQVRQIELKKLLTYNGLDSLLEYKVALKQMKLRGAKP